MRVYVGHIIIILCVPSEKGKKSILQWCIVVVFHGVHGVDIVVFLY